MTSINIAALINLLGFTTGAVLYAMLLAMVLRRPALAPGAAEPGLRGPRFGVSSNGLLLATAILGLLWNAGALATYGVRDLGFAEPPPFVVALSFAALGFLPAVVVHAALRGRDAATEPTGAPWIKLAAYGLSAAATDGEVSSTASRAAWAARRTGFAAAAGSGHADDETSGSSSPS